MRALDILAAASLAVALWFAVITLIPATFWFEIRSTQVMDSSAGVPPRMIVDRTIHREFIGHWYAGVYQITDNGFVSACQATGSADYSTEAVYPGNLNLDWWTFPVQCDLPPGEYMLRTTWTIEIFGLISKETRSTSNPFTIYH